MDDSRSGKYLNLKEQICVKDVYTVLASLDGGEILDEQFSEEAGGVKNLDSLEIYCHSQACGLP
jgi:hypothetical protein